jgi:hypothetical protein
MCLKASKTNFLQRTLLRVPILRRVPLVVWLALLVFWMVWNTLALPYYGDDFEHMQLIAQIRAGQLSAWNLIAHPYHGHTLILLRLLFWLGSLPGGMDFTWVRVGIVASHIVGALGCALLCTRWTGSSAAGWIGGTLYAGAAGFINETIWWPSSGIFCLGATFLILAIVALNPNTRSARLALSLSVLMVLAGVLGFNGTLVAALCLPVYCWFVMPRGAFWHRRAPLVYLAAIAFLLGMTALLQSLQGSPPHLQVSPTSLLLGVWLIGTAPFRFFCTWTTFAIPGFTTICILAPLVWIPLAGSIWLLNGYYRRILIAVWTPAILTAILVGLARVDFPNVRYGPGLLYVADRYYYFFLFPLAIHSTLLISIAWKRIAKTPRPLRTAVALSLAACLAAAVVASRSRYLANVPADHFQTASRALHQGKLLVQTIQSQAQTDHALILTDGPMAVDGAQNSALTIAFVVYSEFPRGIPGVRVVQEPVDNRQAALENSILDRWTALAGFTVPPACVVENGRLERVRASSSIDFHRGSFEEALTSGFSWWEGAFRWMSGRASLRLAAASGDLTIMAYAPLDLLRKKWPALRAIQVTVAVNDRPAGMFSVDGSQVGEYHLRPPFSSNGKVGITLTSDFVWHARDIIPQSLDERDLSIAITAIGFGDLREPLGWSSCSSRVAVLP